MTLSADWWHIDLRSLISSLGAQFIIEADLPGLVFRDASAAWYAAPSEWST